MVAFPAFLDTCVLYPAYLCDTLLRLAEASAYRPSDALVTGYESLVDGMTNHPKDRHVLAAALRANAEVIVTFNLRDFSEPALKPYDIAAIHPDDFLGPAGRRGP